MRGGQGVVIAETGDKKLFQAGAAADAVTPRSLAARIPPSCVPSRYGRYHVRRGGFNACRRARRERPQGPTPVLVGCDAEGCDAGQGLTLAPLQSST
jgi:hypothetical protein